VAPVAKEAEPLADWEKELIATPETPATTEATGE
jgi:hypothetical protein